MSNQPLDVQNIILIGFMAAGKSCVGRLLAQEFDWDFLDTDAAIEDVTGLTVSDLFRKYGEARFRLEESLLIRRLSDIRRTVIATGGGMVSNPDNLEGLRKLGVMIHLYVPLDTALERIKRPQGRPLLAKNYAELEKLWLERQKLYNQASLTVDTTGKKPSSVAAEIAAYLKGVHTCCNN